MGGRGSKGRASIEVGVGRGGEVWEEKWWWGSR